MYRHILAPTDGSEVARRGMEEGLSLAKALGAQVTIITVTEPYPVYTDGLVLPSWGGDGRLMAELLASQEQSAQAILTAAKQSADQIGVSAKTLYVSDRTPAEAILEAAKAQNCDLIVMASHGRRGLGRLVLGSKTAEVLVQSPVPVLVVRDRALAD